jgi:hypothetical protein
VVGARRWAASSRGQYWLRPAAAHAAGTGPAFGRCTSHAAALIMTPPLRAGQGCRHPTPRPCPAQALHALPLPRPQALTGRWKRVCVQANTQGMALRPSTPLVTLRLAGRDPMLRRPSSCRGGGAFEFKRGRFVHTLQTSEAVGRSDQGGGAEGPAPPGTPRGPQAAAGAGAGAGAGPRPRLGRAPRAARLFAVRRGPALCCTCAGVARLKYSTNSGRRKT